MCDIENAVSRFYFYSTIPDWEPYVDDLSGELLYVDCHPFVTQNKDHNPKEPPQPFSKTQLRKSTRGKFLRLIRRRESKRRSRKGPKPLDDVVENSNTLKVKFQDCQEGEEKDVTLEIDSENRYNLSSDKSLAESLLGINVSTLSDGNRVMIAGFSFDSKAKNERNIKIGDWLKSINGIDVNVDNLDDILQKFINHDEVLLKLQRVAATEVTKDPPINELNLESNFVKELMNCKAEDEATLMQALCKHPVGVVYLDTEKLNENKQPNEDVIYCFPRPLQRNALCNARGSFITLSHLLQDVTNSDANSSTFFYKQRLVHIVYTKLDKKLLLFMLPDDRLSIKEVSLLHEQLVRLLEFSYESVDQCFTTERHANQVDWFFSRFFARIMSDCSWATIKQFLEQQDSNEATPCLFEDVLPYVPNLNLQDEALMQVDDALAELEASDYREWNEEPLDCQRLFTILGSALFHSGYLVASHFIQDDLIDVCCFCKQQGFFYLSRSEPVKSLVFWKEVFPSSCKNFPSAIKFPLARRYLLIVGSGKDLLTVLMEAGGCTESAEPNMGPDAFYVEEAQATLAHVQELGVGELADRSVANNSGFGIVTPTPPASKKKTDFMGTLNFPRASSSLVKEPAPSAKRTEVTSILKRRSSDQNFSSSLVEDVYDAYSEGSDSQCYSERMSEISDDSGIRQKNDEDSDTDEFMDGSQISTSSFDISEMRQSLLSEMGDYVPVQLTVGETNILYDFIHLDATEGILISPLDCNLKSQTYHNITNNFRRCCQIIHGVFQNTLRFKNMPAQDIAKTLMNKSLIAIKEYGVVFECLYVDEKENNKRNKITYWVVGRLFYMPHPREVYVCYQELVPQNMVELAFKIGLNCSF
ncbi:protein inturned isoform X2 [Cylas formicarius]|uniref:protein inturned isoform X2 n=1 Tax=Cylas formicarius TaxID=197179 RepID=UPI00295890A0|nr:protein inturned isoform X2 [Cylas formicarius]